MTGEKPLPTPVRQVLARVVICLPEDGDPPYVVLPEQLERKLYIEVNDVLERLGGTWVRRIKAHQFATDPSLILEEVISTGIIPVRNPLDFYETPSAVVGPFLDLLVRYHPGRRCLEPSAGNGALVRGLLRMGFDRIDTVEVDLHRVETLTALYRNASIRGQLYKVDFLSWWGSDFGYDVIAMNPPFRSPIDPNAYIAHIQHAWSLLAPGGELVAITPAGLRFRTDRRVSELRQLIEAHGRLEPLPEDAFIISGTAVQTVAVYISAPSKEQER